MVAETAYTSRPEGYDRIGSYCGGSNVKNSKVEFFAPTVMMISDRHGVREKTMSWPLQYVAPGKSLETLPPLPEPTVPRLSLKTVPETVVAVTRFEVAATEPVVRGYTSQLLSDIQRDGLIPSPAATQSGEVIVGQYDALFSLNKRRNEVWVELSSHPWQSRGVITRE